MSLKNESNQKIIDKFNSNFSINRLENELNKKEIDLNFAIINDGINKPVKKISSTNFEKNKEMLKKNSLFNKEIKVNNNNENNQEQEISLVNIKDYCWSEIVNLNYFEYIKYTLNCKSRSKKVAVLLDRTHTKLDFYEILKLNI